MELWKRVYHYAADKDNLTDVKILTLDGRDYLYAVQPLRDYLGSTDSNQPDAGEIVIWQDITHIYATFYKDLLSSLYYAIAAFF